MKTPKFKAYGNRVFVDIEQAVKTPGGLHLPENVKRDQFAEATVVSVGPGVMTQFGWDAPNVQIGDRVTFELTRSQPIDKKNFIASIWSGDIIGVESAEELTRSPNYLVESAS